MTKAKNERVWGVDWVFRPDRSRYLLRVLQDGSVQWTPVERRAARMTRAEALRVARGWGAAWREWREFVAVVRREPLPKAKATPKRRAR